MKEILKLIEEVDPSDTNMLDEIDARIWCFLHQRDFVAVTFSAECYYKSYLGHVKFKVFGGEYKSIKCHKTRKDKGLKTNPEKSCPAYSRSLDAIKSISPDGWFISTTAYLGGEFNVTLVTHPVYHKTADLLLPTEELARLHAVIQAIDYERQNDEKS